MKFSIVIPTYNHCEDLLQPCIRSIIEYTDMADVELIVSANGCKDNTKEYCESIGVKLVWNDDAIGYSRATNAGIVASTGEYVILLNNDTILLPQPKNQWLDMLVAPFTDPTVGITGPIKGPSAPANHDFIIFFCAMVKREVIDKIGLLDTVFGVGGGEDTDYCIRAELAGYKTVQVPESPTTFGGGLVIGGFPIYHEGEATMHDVNCVSNWSHIFDANSETLRKRYNDKPLKLNLGCGPYRMEGYINIDLYDKNADMAMDVRDLSKFPNESVDEVFSSHVIEHFSPYQVTNILKEWQRVLKPGGKIVMELPDLDACCKAYATADRGTKYNILSNIYGATEDVVVPHLYGWDFELMCDHLMWAGFKDMVKKPQEIYHGEYSMRIEATK